jgi:putative Ca2+/H+ antiporter (TMEM165/GDT1 family)
MNAWLASTGLVVLAEMGDKTQLLAMALACRFRWQVVMLGVFTATLCNHFLAVVAGTYLTKIIPIYYVQVAASASFILFGFWTLRGDILEGEDKRFNYSPFWTVAVAFFLAEMGDKTQLATVALAAEYKSIISVWLGTTTGMLIADAMGIGIGIVLGKKIPERFIKWVAALIFIFFGLSGLYTLLPSGYLYPIFIISGLVLLGFLIYELSWGKKKETPFPYCKPGKEANSPSANPDFPPVLNLRNKSLEK